MNFDFGVVFTASLLLFTAPPFFRLQLSGSHNTGGGDSLIETVRGTTHSSRRRCLFSSSSSNPPPGHEQNVGQIDKVDMSNPVQTLWMVADTLSELLLSIATRLV